MFAGCELATSRRCLRFMYRMSVKRCDVGRPSIGSMNRSGSMSITISNRPALSSMVVHSK